MKYNRDYYEGEGSNYSLFGGYTSLSLRFCRFFNYRKAMSIIREHKTKGRLLDIGCAYGFWTNFSRKGGFDSTGCDISEFAISKAKEMFPEIEFSQADAEKPMRFHDKEFDVITAFDVLEHCKKLDFTLSEIKRMLKDDGVLLVAVPDIDYFSKKKDRDETHEWYLNLDGWKSEFEKSKLEVKGAWIFPDKIKRINPRWCIRLILAGYK